MIGVLLSGLALVPHAYAQSSAPVVEPASSTPAKVLAAPAPSSEITTTPLHVEGAPTLKEVSVSRTPEGGDVLKLQFEGSAPSVNLKQTERNIVLDIGSTPLTSAAQQRLSSLPPGVSVQSVRSSTSGPMQQIDIGLKNSVVVSAYQTGSFYVLEMQPKIQPVNQAVQNTRTSLTQAQAARSAVRYSGKPVTFNFQDVPVRTVLQLIADESNFNIVASDTVQGSVTLRLIGVPWDQALDIVLQSKGLDKRRDGRVIWVAPQPELAKFEQDKEDARIALDNRVDLQTDYIQINYHNAGNIFKALTEAKGIGGGNGGGENEGKASENSFLSPRGRLVADERTNTLVISDIPKKIAQMRDLIATIDRPVDQVLIESRIVIANETFARDLGARFGVFGTRSGNNTAIIGNTIENNRGGLAGPVVNLPAGGFTNSPAASLAYTLLGSNFSLDFELSAMQEEGRGEVISNPRLITSNQREAVIRQGKEVGYVTITGSGSGGAATPTVQFKEALLELKVTPTITNDNRVFLNLNVKKDEIESFLDLGDYGAVPQFNKREINTAVLIEDGQTVVIGGVYEFSDRDSVAKVPFLGDVPFLGNLFKKKGRSKQKAELLVFITPKTIRVAPQISSLAPIADEGTK